MATLGYVGSVAGPIMIGWLAEATSLRASLGLVVIGVHSPEFEFGTRAENVDQLTQIAVLPGGSVVIEARE